DIEHDSRLLLYRIFDRHVMQGYWRVLDRLDELLDREGILSGLTYVPARIRPAPPPREPAEATRPAAAAEPARGPGAPAPSGQGRAAYHSTDPQRPHTGWMGEPIEDVDEDEQLASQQLQQLLNSRRELLGKLRPGRKAAPGALMPTDEVFSALGHLQGQSLTAGGAPQTLADVKQTLLAQARQRRGVHAELSPRDNDAFELLGMLFSNLEEEIRSSAPAASLVKRLQVPLLRVALRDSAFFVRSRHPARQLDRKS